MANRKSKALAVTTVTGVTGILDELYARGREGTEVEGAAVARASRTLNLGGDSGDSLSSSREKAEETTRLPVTTTPDRGGDRGGDTGDSEALRLPLAFWADLPRPSSTHVRTASGRTWWLTASRQRLSDAARDGEAAFGPNEYEAALGAILVGRATPATLDAWIARKLSAPEWRLSAAVAMAGAVGLLARGSRVRAECLDVSVGVALERAGCTVLAVVVEEPAVAASSTVEHGQEFAAL